MERLQQVAERIARWGAIAGGAMLLVASVVICVDIVLRYALAMTVGGADELAGYALAIASVWGFSTALLARSHIRIDTVYVRVGARTRAALDVLNLVCLTFFIGLVAWHGWGVLEQSWVSNSHSLSDLQTPLIVPQALWFAGLAFFVVVAVLLLARALLAFGSGDFAAGFALIGSKSAVAEAEEEIRSAELVLDKENKS
ncbi:MAG: TRAP transporter small permease subunit [Hyphomicrobiaceae bacterium]